MRKRDAEYNALSVGEAAVGFMRRPIYDLAGMTDGSAIASIRSRTSVGE